MNGFYSIKAKNATLKILMVFLIVCFQIVNSSGLVLHAVVTTSPTIITISDSVLESAVRLNISKPVGNLTTSDCLKVTDLSINFANLPTLKPLEMFPNLQKLTLSNSNTKDISSLSKLKKLKNIVLGGNEISSIEPLTLLPVLREIEIVQDVPLDLAPLGKIKTLWHINILHIPITDLNIFNDLSKLEILTLYDNQISDLRPLSKHTQLINFGIGRSQVSDIRPLATLKNLQHLEVFESRLTSIADIQYVIKNMNLVTLNISENPIRDYSALKSYFERPVSERQFNIDRYNEFQTLATKCSGIIDSIIKPGMSEVEKELAIHDYLIENTEYDYTFASSSGYANGPILHGKGFCNGYSQAFALLCRYAGFDCFVVGGYVGIVSMEYDEKVNNGLHAWNKIRIDGVLHNVDTTWDDAPGDISYEYFNCADYEMKIHWSFPLYPEAPGGNNEWLSFVYPQLAQFGGPVKATFKIALPDNEIAFDDPFFHGVPIQAQIVNMTTSDMTDYRFSKGLSVVIPAGKNSIEVSTWVPAGLEMMYVLYDMPASRSLASKIADRGWIRTGYLMNNGMQNEINASNFLTTDDFKNRVMDISVMKGVTVSGRIQLPAGFVNDKGVNVNAYARSGLSSLLISPSYLIPKGKTATDYRLIVPYDSHYKISFYTDALGCVNNTYLDYNGLSKLESDYALSIAHDNVVLSTMTFPFTNPQSGAAFKDVPAGSALEKNVVLLYEKGIITGDGAGNIMPKSLVSRAEFAAMLVRMKNKESVTKNVSVCRFSDVKFEKWYSNYIEVAAQLDLVSGVGNGKFNPDGNITGVQALSALVRMFATPEELNSKYPDNDWKEIALLGAIEFKIIGSNEQPSDLPITREQLITYVAAALVQ